MRAWMDDIRAPLAAALKTRNAAAKELTDAEGKLIDLAGEVPGQYNPSPSGPYYEALSAQYAAEDAYDHLKDEIARVETSVMGDRHRVGEYFLRHRDALPSELLKAAEEKIEAAKAALVPIKTAKEKLEIRYEVAKQNAAFATTRLEDAARAVLGSEVLDLAAVAKTASDDALRACAALKFAANGVDLSAPEFAAVKKLLSDYISFYDADKKAQQEAGAAPWLAAFNNLLVDHNAPLPTDPAPTTVVPMRKAS